MIITINSGSTLKKIDISCMMSSFCRLSVNLVDNPVFAGGQIKFRGMHRLIA